MKGIKSTVAVLAVLVCLGGFASVVDAAQIRGTVQALDAMDSLGATAHDQMRTGSGKSLAVVCAGASGLLLLGGFVGPAVLGFAGSIGSVFLQNATAGAYDSAPAAAGMLEVLVPFARTLEGFAGNRLMYDPVFYVALGLSLCAVWSANRRQAHTAQAA